MNKYPPGVWEDDDGGLHFDIPTIMKRLNVLDTPENRAGMTILFERLIKEQLPQAEVTVDDNCPVCKKKHEN